MSERSRWTIPALRSETGAAFDPRCVDALAKVLGVPEAPQWVADVARRDVRSTGGRAAYSRPWPAPPSA